MSQHENPGSIIGKMMTQIIALDHVTIATCILLKIFLFQPTGNSILIVLVFVPDADEPLAFFSLFMLFFILPGSTLSRVDMLTCSSV